MQDFSGQVMEEAILFHSRAVVWDTEARAEEWRGAGKTFRRQVSVHFGVH